MNTPRLYQLASQSPSQMMSYLFQSRDGSLAVLDGGCKEDSGHLLKALRLLGGERPHISLWLLSHPHHDHIGAFDDLWQHQRDAFTVDKLCCRFPDPALMEDYEPQYAFASWEFAALSPSLQDRLHRLSTGERFTVGDFTFHVLFTSDTLYRRHTGNNVSSVIGVDVLGCRLLFPGDLGEEAQDRLLTGPQALKADVVQMAHHGQSAVTKDFYRQVSPHLCLWPTPDWLWRNDAGQGEGTGPWTTLETRRWMEELGVVSHLVAKDGDGMVRFLGDGRFSFGLARWKLPGQPEGSFIP